MITVVPLATASLDARAFFTRSWSGGWLVATDGHDVFVLDANLNVLSRVDAGAPPTDIAMPRAGLLLLATPHSLSARDTHDGRTTWSVPGHFLGCRTLDDNTFWTTEHRDRDIELSLRDVATGAVLRQTRVPDPFGGSATMFGAHPSRHRTVVWVAAGQDGQTAHLVTDTMTAIETAEIAPRDRLPPIFLLDGESYLSSGDDLLERYAWPDGQRLGTMAWPVTDDDHHDDHDDDHDDEHDNYDAAGSDVQLLPGNYAAWSSTNGRIYIVDLVEMRIVDELTIAGHPLRAVEDLYPVLHGDRTPCTDFEYAEPGALDTILTVHAESQLVLSRIRDWSPDHAR